MNKKLSLTLILSLISAIPLVVSADDDSRKTNVSVGMMDDITDEGLFALEGAGVTIDDSDTATIFTVGYKVSPNLAWEGSIITSREVSAVYTVGQSGTLSGKAYSVNGSVTVKKETSEAYLLGVKFSGGSGPLGINIKAGQLFWDVDYIATVGGTLTYDGTAYSGSGSAKFLSADGSDPYLGIGISYAVGKNSSLELDYISSEIHDNDFGGYSLSWVGNF